MLPGETHAPRSRYRRPWAYPCRMALDHEMTVDRDEALGLYLQFSARCSCGWCGNMRGGRDGESAAAWDFEEHVLRDVGSRECPLGFDPPERPDAVTWVVPQVDCFVLWFRCCGETMLTDPTDSAVQTGQRDHYAMHHGLRVPFESVRPSHLLARRRTARPDRN